MAGNRCVWHTIKPITLFIILTLLGSGATLANGLSPAQQAAVRTAQQYLKYSPFSKKQLIRQLASSAGKQYTHATAQAAVASLNVNWRHQAVRAAKRHIKYGNYTCNRLILQLHSSAGAGFTMAQAKYGARQTTLCSSNNTNGSN